MNLSILTTPSFSGGHSHLIPLFVLHQRYFRNMQGIKNSFLLPLKYHKLIKDAGITVCNIDYSLPPNLDLNNFYKSKREIQKKEEEAFFNIRPNIIIEDNSFSIPLIAEKNSIPRISIHRTGFFRSLPIDKRNTKHIHSIEKGSSNRRLIDASFYLRSDFPNLKYLENRTDVNYLKNYLNAKTKIIPGIPSIEVLPKDINNKKSYFYSGPLIMEDNPSKELVKKIEKFKYLNRHKKIIFITTGLIDTMNINEYIDYLLDKNYAVISTQSYRKMKVKYTDSFFCNNFLPLNYICSISDLIIHQCGSGIYHYPILNEKPFLTIGTQCYDREDIALRLQDLKISKHVPHPRDNDSYMKIFINSIMSFENNTLCDFKKLNELKNEIFETMLSFDMLKLIKNTL